MTGNDRSANAMRPTDETIRAGAEGIGGYKETDSQRKTINPRITAAGNQLDAFIGANTLTQGTRVSDRSGSVFGEWPVQLTTADPYDQTVSIRKQVIKGSNNNGSGIQSVPGVGMAMVGDEYFNWVERKQRVYQAGKFKEWLLSQIDMSSPEKAAFWKERYPEVFAERRELFMQQQKLTEQLAKIQMLGPDSLQDYQLIWMIQEGMITLPRGPAWNPKFMPNQDDFVRGMFSVKRIAPELISGRNTPVKTSLIPWSSPLQTTDQETGTFWPSPNAGAGFFGNLQNMLTGQGAGLRV